MPTKSEALAELARRGVPVPRAAPRLTEAQAKDSFGAKRMAGASETLRALEGSGFDASGISASVGLPTTPNRRYEAAANEWADSLLRMTTGAAATKDEMANTRKTYFPQFGDSPDVRAQKAAARARVERDARARAGMIAPSTEMDPTAALANQLAVGTMPDGAGGGRAVAAKPPHRLSDEEIKAALGL